MSVIRKGGGTPTRYGKQKQKRGLTRLKASKTRRKRRIDPEIGWSATDLDAGEPGSWKRLLRDSHADAARFDK